VRFDVEPVLVCGHESMSIFHGSFEKACGLDCHYDLVNHLLLCVERLCDECYDIALL
jgi:hypothetical protein